MKEYKKPEICVFEARVEKGFMGSGDNTPNIPDGEHGTQPVGDNGTYRWN